MSLQAFTGQRTSTEYLVLERAAEAKSELVDGVMVAMTGASRAHSLIATNLLRAWGTRRDSRSERHGRACAASTVGGLASLRSAAPHERLAPRPASTLACAWPCVILDPWSLP